LEHGSLERHLELFLFDRHPVLPELRRTQTDALDVVD
jgi:hypothetical protein